MSGDTFPQVGLLAETLLEASAQDNAVTGVEISRLRQETRAKKRKLAQARRERALKAMNVGTTTAVSVPGTSVRGVTTFSMFIFINVVPFARCLVSLPVTILKMIAFTLRQPKDMKRIVHIFSVIISPDTCNRREAMRQARGGLYRAKEACRRPHRRGVEARRLLERKRSSWRR